MTDPLAVDPLGPLGGEKPPVSTAGHFLGVVVLLGIAALVTYVAWGWWPDRPRFHPKVTVAKAVITTVDGKVPGAVPAHSLLVLTSDRAIAARVRWTVLPPGTQHRLTGDRLVVEAGAGGTVTVRQLAVKADTIDEAEVSIAVKGGPAGPAPGAVTGPVDPRVRAAAAGYYAVYHKAYGNIPTMLAAASPTYNDVTQTVLDARTAAGTALGEAVDALVKPLYDDQLRFTDKARAAQVYQLVSNSLRAGMIDAAAAK